ncbi:hypothetical protein ILUMI_26309 [Ignelater luminosus]|uniref:CHK kinase-like domain-containing protein n=1 Tax=Ignelater luminosus TaxID=2038154 RepID=A0A8K0FXF4_IGNLU|nr:hypothetical protein ILUMI_26309 [Ignelater luminosus]
MYINKESVLSLQDCNQIIKNYLNSEEFHVLDYEVQPFSDTVNGFMGDHLLIKIKFALKNVENEVRFFAKRFPFNHELQSRYALSVKAFTNEIFTYQVIFNKFKKFDGFNDEFAPKYYFGKDNDLIVFEDLSEKGFVLPEPTNALPLDIVKFCLKILAKYHSGSIGYQELKSKKQGKRYRLIDEYPDCMQEPLFRKDESFLGYGWFRARLSALKSIIDLLPPSKNITKEEFKKALDQVAESSFEIMKPKDNFYNVLCHGDVWAKNVMFRYENGIPVECKLVDFQLQRYCPPAHDVLQFIYLTTSTERRKHHFYDLLRYYHNSLKMELRKGNLDIETIISYEDFEISVNYLLPQIKLQTAYYYTFQGANPEFHKNVTTNLEDFKKFVFGDGAPFSIDLFKTDDNYKRLMTETLSELEDYVTHHRLTLEDCFKIIPSKIKTTNYKLLNYYLEPLKKIGGFLGDHYKLKINVLVDNQPKTLNLFAKCSPENTTRFDMAMGSRAFDKESCMLQKLLPLIQEMGIDVIDSCVIPYHLIRANDVIVFDDLEFDDFYAADPRVPFDFEHLQIIVRKLAVYHASNIVVEEKIGQDLSRKFRLNERFESEFAESFFPTKNHHPSSLSIKLGIDTVDYQIDMFPELSKGISQEDFKQRSKKAYEAIYELVKSSEKYRNVVCHGDLWASNIMMKYKNEKPIDCLIIDYQILRYCPPAHDLLCVLYLTTNRKTRAQFATKLMDIYYEKFKETLEKYGCDVNTIYPYHKFMESCEYMTPQAVCQTVIYYHCIMTNSDLMKEYTASEESTNKIFLVDRRDFLKDMCERDPIYRERMKESIEDLRDMCLKYF